jgi:hypothetical protein
VAGDFGALAGLASPCPGTAIFLHAWPHEMLCHQQTIANYYQLQRLIMKIYIENKISKPLCVFSLRFVAHFGNSGHYKCEAMNDAGSDRKDISLLVLGKLNHHAFPQ